jgi:hypothetical protein
MRNAMLNKRNGRNSLSGALTATLVVLSALAVDPISSLVKRSINAGAGS